MSDYTTYHCNACGHEHPVGDVCAKARQSELAAPTGYPAPSWDDFARRVKKEWPQMEPLIRGQEWMNLYAVFKMGYGAALEDVAKLLAQENSDSAYRMLKEGEIIQEGDFFLDDAGMWRKTICAGQPAPHPKFTAHRQYRRYTPND